MLQYFSRLFSSEGCTSLDEVLGCVEPKVTEGMNTTLCAQYSADEVEQALKQMHLHKALGPDGLNPFFFQKYWEIVGLFSSKNIGRL